MIIDPLRARRALVVAPHPDDETIGAWALMRRLKQGGAGITVIIVSDGGASHPGSERWPKPRLISERRRETLRAMRSLSVMPPQVKFLSFADGALEQSVATISRALTKTVRCRVRPDLIVGPVAHDDHSDHAAVARALRAVKLTGARRLGFLVWPGRPSRAGSRLHVKLGGALIQAKRRAVRSYRTQMGMINDADGGFRVTHRHLKLFAGPRECFEVLR